MSFALTRERKEEADVILKRYPVKRAALLPILWLVHEQEGYISDEAIEFVATFLDLSPAEVFGAVTFYTMFGRKPVGRHHIQVCTNICCKLRGADWLLNYVKEKLGIDVGASTEDKKFYLSTVECLGSCGTAPMMRIDNDYYENLNEEKVDEILKNLTTKTQRHKEK
jgi:NADH-quinone oxidoreductase E subunit